MSRIGNKPISIPADVKVAIEGRNLAISGPRGELKLAIHPLAAVKQKDDRLEVLRKNETKPAKSIHGLTRALLNVSIQGVKDGFIKKLELVGTGYRVAKQGQGLSLSLGFSHSVTVDPIEGITFEVEGNTVILVKGIDKQSVGQAAANIRALRPPEPYKGKGIKYSDEVVRRKPGKQAKAGTAV